ncbi:MAG: L-lysine 2,3-aminomutase [Candidatus Electronema aureum]|uniref:L-lysine 2,3-aminomutase n=1 Tax=Candidatus Electronema aureum TaxID=2005002 RepID=A0A521FYG9_9BACT|nr:MAG: L-lysine 2,3-aminomutase [Candidatus Electronema aureum]
MTSWQEELKNAITNSAGLACALGYDPAAAEAIIARYPMRITPYYLELIKKAGEPLRRQAVPDLRELEDPVGMEDPLGEENLSPVPNLVHKYPDRVLLLVSGQCAMYCRFCTRKRKVGGEALRFSEEHFVAALDYLRNTPSVREVLISGGDPLLLADERLEDILRRLREIKSIEIIRIGTRTPCTLPMRITPKLCAMLRQFHPLYINTHFNHPAELTKEAERACTLLADAGIPLGCQTVLLKGVNDSAEVLGKLFCGLLRLRVKPYYLMQADLTKGTGHFRTPIKAGLEIMRQLIGTVSGMAVPKFVLDAPSGKGKIPLTPDYITAMQEGRLEFVNFQGLPCSYPLE